MGEEALVFSDRARACQHATASVYVAKSTSSSEYRRVSLWFVMTTPPAT
jgi:hypothetical protein